MPNGNEERRAGDYESRRLVTRRVDRLRKTKTRKKKRRKRKREKKKPTGVRMHHREEKKMLVDYVTGFF